MKTEITKMRSANSAVVLNVFSLSLIRGWAWEGELYGGDPGGEGDPGGDGLVRLGAQLVPRDAHAGGGQHGEGGRQGDVGGPGIHIRLMRCLYRVRQQVIHYVTLHCNPLL